MTMSNIDAVMFALTPGAAEQIMEEANRSGNAAWLGMATGVKYARDAVYIGVALVAIAALGAAFTAAIGTATLVASIGASLTTFAAVKLYEMTAFIQLAVNANRRP